MKSFIGILAFVALAAANPVNYWGGKIVGGEDTSIQNVPYQVSLQVYGRHYCGASIISEEWVLTAAHCATRSARSYRLRVGSSLVNAGGSLHSVKKIISHENYSTNKYGIPTEDIALLRLNEPIVFDEGRKPIDLFEDNEETPAGINAMITGWGRTDWGTPSVLQAVTVPVVSKEDCDAAYVKYGGVPVGQICAAVPEGGKDSCQGDSGGPMMIDGRLAGIVSWGVGCGTPGYPGAYTEVAHYRDWVRAHTGF